MTTYVIYEVERYNRHSLRAVASVEAETTTAAVSSHLGYPLEPTGYVWRDTLVLRHGGNWHDYYETHEPDQIFIVLPDELVRRSFHDAAPTMVHLPGFFTQEDL